MRRRPSRTLAFKVVVLLLGGLMFYMGNYLGHLYQRERLEGLSATVLPEPRPTQPFNLVDQNGKPFTADDLKGHWNFLFFGYTQCPDVCPTALAQLSQVYNRLAERPELQKRSRAVFISVDPARDTPAKLKQFVGYFNPEFLGVTGSDAEIAKLTHQFGIFVERHAPAPGSKDYAVDHTAVTTLVDPEGRTVAIFSSISDPARVAHDFFKIVDYIQD